MEHVAVDDVVIDDACLSRLVRTGGWWPVATDAVTWDTPLEHPWNLVRADTEDWGGNGHHGRAASGSYDATDTTPVRTLRDIYEFFTGVRATNKLEALQQGLEPRRFGLPPGEWGTHMNEDYLAACDIATWLLDGVSHHFEVHANSRMLIAWTER